MPDLASPDYWITRFVFQRLLACIYLIGFIVVVNQFIPLCGAKGLEPASLYLSRLRFWQAPSLFWINSSDQFFLLMGWLGVVLSILAVSGISDSYGIYFSVFVWGLLWLLYLSFVNIGQTFYSFGWEILLLEAGFLTIFMGSSDTKVPVITIWLLRWLLFRLMFGAGLIKLRGDECWKDLTCMLYHYETQPLPNPLSWYFHHLPVPIHKAAVLFNHFTELLVPFGYFFRGIIGALAGGITIIFQLLLVVSGNFSWLNWITIVLAVSCFNDSQLSFLPFRPPTQFTPHPLHTYAIYGLTALIAYLSIGPTTNLLSSRQIMNTSFDPLHLVNTYGAFGSITKVREEIIIEGTQGDLDGGDWKEYEFRAKPGDVNRTPPIIAPYHLRIDWLMWFAPFSSCEFNPWLYHLLQKLLQGDKAALSLLRTDPFPDGPPKHIRSTRYEYHFTTPEERKTTGAIWKRTLIGPYCPTLSRRDGP